MTIPNFIIWKTNRGPLLLSSPTKSSTTITIYEEDVSPDASGVRGRKEEDVVTEPKLKKSHLE